MGKVIIPPKKGTRIRDKHTGRIGVFTGEEYTSFPPCWGVQYEDDGSYGSVWDPHAERLSEEEE